MRRLTSDEMMVLERAGCSAQDWAEVHVADVGFKAVGVNVNEK